MYDLVAILLISKIVQKKKTWYTLHTHLPNNSKLCTNGRNAIRKRFK